MFKVEILFISFDNNVQVVCLVLNQLSIDLKKTDGVDFSPIISFSYIQRIWDEVIILFVDPSHDVFIDKIGGYYQLYLCFQ